VLQLRHGVAARLRLYVWPRVSVHYVRICSQLSTSADFVAKSKNQRALQRMRAARQKMADERLAAAQTRDWTTVVQLGVMVRAAPPPPRFVPMCA
jgi:hypothetical protein